MARLLRSPLLWLAAAALVLAAGYLVWNQGVSLNLYASRDAAIRQ